MRTSFLKSLRKAQAAIGNVCRGKQWPLMALTVCAILGLASAAKTGAQTAGQIGVYDSRAIAYAGFWSAEHQKEIRAMAAEAEKAKAAGDTTRFNTLKQKIEAEQRAIHLQVFSTAPAESWLAGLSSEMAQLQKDRTLVRIVSKWDDEALKGYPARRQIDVTDALLAHFTLNEKQLKTVKELRGKKPLPLSKAKRMEEKGQL